MFTPTVTPSRALITVFDSTPQSVGESLKLAAELRRHDIPCDVT